MKQILIFLIILLNYSSCTTEELTVETETEVLSRIAQSLKVFPENYGAVGDGITLDGDAFINAIADVPEGGRLVLKKGKNYVIDKEILLKSNMTIAGNGAEITVDPDNWAKVNSGFYAIFATVHVYDKPYAAPSFNMGDGITKFRNISIQNVTFNLNRDATKQFVKDNIIHFSFNAVRFTDTENSRVTNCRFLDLQNENTFTIMPVVAFERSINCKFTYNTSNNCTPFNNSWGVGTIVNKNKIDNTPSTAIEMYVGNGHRITGNTIGTQWFDASAIGVSSDYSYVGGNTLTDNRIIGITLGHAESPSYPNENFGSDYTVCKNNYVTGGKVGILLQNGIGVKILRNTIEDLDKESVYTRDNAGIMVGVDLDPNNYKDLKIANNKISNVTAGIVVRNNLNCSIYKNTISNVFRGIYGETSINRSPNGVMRVNSNIITDSAEPLFFSGAKSIVTNNTVDRASSYTYLYYGEIIFRNNTYNESLKEIVLYETLGVTMKDNSFTNTIPLQWVTRLHAPEMSVDKLIIENNVINSPIFMRVNKLLEYPSVTYWDGLGNIL